jgi:hypothetical protein
MFLCCSFNTSSYLPSSYLHEQIHEIDFDELIYLIASLQEREKVEAVICKAAKP